MSDALARAAKAMRAAEVRFDRTRTADDELRLARAVAAYERARADHLADRLSAALARQFTHRISLAPAGGKGQGEGGLK